jgi:tetratricopeptide (TPR) repeat protein
MRFVWRGEALVAVGGDEGLRRPTAVFVPVGPGRAARFEPATGRTTLLQFDPPADPDRVAIQVGDEPLRAARDRIDVVPPPDRSLVRALLPVIIDDGVEAGIGEYERLAADDSARVETSEDALNALGYALLHMGATDPALALFRYVTELYPDSWNAWDSLGEAQLAAGDTVAGRESYAVSLRLNPENETARQVVGAEQGEDVADTRPK